LNIHETIITVAAACLAALRRGITHAAAVAADEALIGIKSGRLTAERSAST
jgi:hypothetical protein